MKNIVATLLMLTQFAFAGNDQGGGGHPCKAEAMLLINNINGIYNKDTELQTLFPEWTKMRNVVDPEQNPNFVFQISETPIQNCPDTENPLFCSLPKENKMQLNCGESGWDSLGQYEKYKHLIHELYWWTDLIDRNYFYSIPFAQAVYKKIHENNSGKIFVSLGKGDIQSVRYAQDNVSCVMIQTDESNWLKKTREDYECTSKTCNYSVQVNYTIIVNNEIKIPIQTSKLFNTYKPTLFSTIKKNCRAKRFYDEAIQDWEYKFQEIQYGTKKTSLISQLKSPKISSNYCESKTLEGFLNLETKETTDFFIRTTSRQCK